MVLPREPAPTVCLLISGRVQGVGYRMWAVAVARRLGLTGWVRNLTDGTVEALAHGQSDAVTAFAQACHEGPAGYGVTSVDVKPSEKPFEGADFEQRATSSPGAQY